MLRDVQLSQLPDGRTDGSLVPVDLCQSNPLPSVPTIFINRGLDGRIGMCFIYIKVTVIPPPGPRQRFERFEKNVVFAIEKLFIHSPKS